MRLIEGSADIEAEGSAEDSTDGGSFFAHFNKETTGDFGRSEVQDKVLEFEREAY